MTAKAEHTLEQLAEKRLAHEALTVAKSIQSDVKDLATVKPRRLVVIESPLAGSLRRNLAYARAACRYAIKLGFAPYASHLHFAASGVLDDDVTEERDLGIACGLAWSAKADLTLAFVDYGISSGMRLGIEAAQKAGRLVEYHSLPASDWEWPPK